MIVNKLKPCCEDCRFIDGAFSTEKNNCVVGTSNVTSVIYCEHMPVCKSYIECDMKNANIPTKHDVMRKELKHSIIDLDADHFRLSDILQIIDDVFTKYGMGFVNELRNEVSNGL